MPKTKIILVDENDNKIGIGEKLKVHQDGKLHRAFSILVFNSKKELLIQQRAATKYHSANLWSNTCCSHPKPNETLKKAVKRRLKEEMGIKSDLKEVFSFIYKVKLGNLIEHEFNHVFIGRFNGNPKPNKEEIKDWKWVNLKELQKDVKENPQKYAYWFKIILDRIYGP